jgi:hypothetical protein
MLQRRNPCRLVAQVPRTIDRLRREDRRAEPLTCDPRTLGRDGVRIATGEVTQDLPADRRVAFEEPVDLHARIIERADGSTELGTIRRRRIVRNAARAHERTRRCERPAS